MTPREERRAAYFLDDLDHKIKEAYHAIAVGACTSALRRLIDIEIHVTHFAYRFPKDIGGDLEDKFGEIANSTYDLRSKFVSKFCRGN